MHPQRIIVRLRTFFEASSDDSLILIFNFGLPVFSWGIKGVVG